VARAFVSYKHGAEPDEHLAEYFMQYLTDQGHQVFIDRQIRIGQEWPTIIKQELQLVDFLIVLLSEHSITSEMIIEEVAIAHQLKKQQGTPLILPIRVVYTGSLPYDLGAMLNRVQYALWERNGDEATIGKQLNLAMVQNQEFEGGPPEPLEAIALTTDGNEAQPDRELTSPLPAFDPQWLEKLDAPGGAVRLQSPFYIERGVDDLSKELILKEGITLRIKGCRQMGKSSLLARLHQHARDENRPVLYIDFQRLDNHHFRDIETLLRYLADFVAYKLKTNESPDRYWQTPLGPKDKLTDFLSYEVLEHVATPLVLLMDEVDRVFAFEHYRDDFFSLIRSWHNDRAFDPLWGRLNLVLAYSTEAFLFITDLNQSPFNVGNAFELDDFDRTQVEELNRRHGSPVKTTQEMDDVMELLQGHPFLLRKALYALVVQELTVGQLIDRACDDDGPFSDHLHRHLWQFDAQPELRAAMGSVIRDQSCPTDRLFYQLRSAGLVGGSDRNNVLPRCGLYTRYFGRHL
jgi:hypothetical protein